MFRSEVDQRLPITFVERCDTAVKAVVVLIHTKSEDRQAVTYLSINLHVEGWQKGPYVPDARGITDVIFKSASRCASDSAV